MAKSSRRSAQVGSSRRISSSRFRLTNVASKPTPISVLDAPFKDRPPGTDQPEAASRHDLELRLEGQRLGCLRDGILRITCSCGPSGEVSVADLDVRHGEGVRVRDTAVTTRYSVCGARRIRGGPLARPNRTGADWQESNRALSLEGPSPAFGP